VAAETVQKTFLCQSPDEGSEGAAARLAEIVG